MKQNHKQISIIMLVTSLLLFGLYFGYANAAGPTATKQFEGVWKPAQFFKADYELGGLKEIPLAEVLGGNGETYLHFKGNKVCSGGILEGSRKKPDAHTAERAVEKHVQNRQAQR